MFYSKDSRRNNTAHAHGRSCSNTAHPYAVVRACESREEKKGEGRFRTFNIIFRIYVQLTLRLHIPSTITHACLAPVNVSIPVLALL